MGLVNTGVLVLRNTAWSRQFLAQWWYGIHSPDQEPGDAQQLEWRSQCDQDAFDRLYAYVTKNTGAREQQDVSTKIKILPMDAINSHPPAMLHQHPHNPVLHLMGETTALRRRAFQWAWTQGVCGPWQDGAPQKQLGLNRTTLQNIARYTLFMASSSFVIYRGRCVRYIVGQRGVRRGGGRLIERCRGCY
jgi:hypothetical protein